MKNKIFITDSENQKLEVFAIKSQEQRLTIKLASLEEKWAEMLAIDRFLTVNDLIREFPDDPRTNFLFAVLLNRYRFSVSYILQPNDPFLEELIKPILQSSPSDAPEQIANGPQLDSNEMINNAMKACYITCIDKSFRADVSYNNLGILALQEKKWQYALLYFINALRKNADFPIARYNLGFCYEKLMNKMNIDRAEYAFDPMYELIDTAKISTPAAPVEPGTASRDEIAEEIKKADPEKLFNPGTIDYCIMLKAGSASAGDKEAAMKALRSLDKIMLKANDRLYEESADYRETLFGEQHAVLIDPDEDFSELFGNLQDPYNLEAGLQRFDEGEAALENGDFLAAIDKFSNARSLNPNLEMHCFQQIQHTRRLIERQFDEAILAMETEGNLETAIEKLAEGRALKIEGVQVINETKYRDTLNRLQRKLAMEKKAEAEQHFEDGDWQLHHPSTAAGQHILEYISNISSEFREVCDTLSHRIKRAEWDREFQKYSELIGNKDSKEVELKTVLERLMVIAKDTVIAGEKYEPAAKELLALSMDLYGHYYQEKSQLLHQEFDYLNAYKYRMLAFQKYNEAYQLLADFETASGRAGGLTANYQHLKKRLDEYRRINRETADGIKAKLIVEVENEVEALIKAKKWGAAEKKAKEKKDDFDKVDITLDLEKIIQNIKILSLKDENEQKILQTIKDIRLEAAEESPAQAEATLMKAIPESDYYKSATAALGLGTSEKPGNPLEYAPPEWIRLREELRHQQLDELLERMEAFPETEFTSRKNIIGRAKALNENRKRVVNQLHAFYHHSLVEKLFTAFDAKKIAKFLRKQPDRKQQEQEILTYLKAEFVSGAMREPLKQRFVQVLESLLKWQYLEWEKAPNRPMSENKEIRHYIHLLREADPENNYAKQIDSAYKNAQAQTAERKAREAAAQKIAETQERKTSAAGLIQKLRTFFTGSANMLLWGSAFILIYLALFSGGLSAQTSGILIVDISQTMIRNDPQEYRKEADQFFVDFYSLRNQAINSSYRLDTRLGMIFMGDEAKDVFPLQPLPLPERDRILQLQNNILKLTPAGKGAVKTNMERSFTRAMNMFEQLSLLHHFKFIVLLSDGIIDPDNNNRFNVEAAAQFRENILPRLIKEGIVVYTIGFRNIQDWDNEELSSGLAFMKEIAKKTSGEYMALERNEDLFKFYLRIISRFYPLVKVEKTNIQQDPTINWIIIADNRPIKIAGPTGEQLTLNNMGESKDGSLQFKTFIYGEPSTYFLTFAQPLAGKADEANISFDITRPVEEVFAFKDFRYEVLSPPSREFRRGEAVRFEVRLTPAIDNLTLEYLKEIKDGYGVQISIKQSGSVPYSVPIIMKSELHSSGAQPSGKAIYFRELYYPPQPGNYQYQISAYSLIGKNKSGFQNHIGTFEVGEEGLFDAAFYVNGNQMENVAGNCSVCDTFRIEVQLKSHQAIQEATLNLEIYNAANGELQQKLGPIIQDIETGHFIHDFQIDDGGRQKVKAIISARFEEIGKSDIAFEQTILLDAPFLGICNKNIYFIFFTLLFFLIGAFWGARQYQRPRLEGPLLINDIMTADLEELAEGGLLGPVLPKHTLKIGNASNSDIYLQLGYEEGRNVAKLSIDAYETLWLDRLDWEASISVSGMAVDERIPLNDPEDMIRDPIKIRIDNNELEI